MSLVGGDYGIVPFAKTGSKSKELVPQWQCVLSPLRLRPESAEVAAWCLSRARRQQPFLAVEVPGWPSAESCAVVDRLLSVGALEVVD